MVKCVGLFNKKHDEFIRVFLFENKSKLEHFKSGLLINRLLFDDKGRLISNTEQNSEKLIDLLLGLNLPIELVLFHRSMACKLFLTKISGIGNINGVAKHALNDSHCNTVFYGRVSNDKSIRFNKKLTYGICTADISNDITKLLLNNSYKLNIFSTSVFPFWVVSTFFNRCKHNVLTPTLLVIDYMDYLHIILTDDGYVVYNRSVSLENKNKNDEVHNTLNYIKNVTNVDMNNLVIYEFGDSVVDYLSAYSELKMKVMSTMFNIKSCRRIENSTFKIACLVFSGVLFSNSITNAYKIKEINEHINNIKNAINDSQITKDIDTWQELHSRNLLNLPNYEDAIKQYTQNKKGKLQNIIMYCESGNKVSVTEEANKNDNIPVDNDNNTDIDGNPVADYSEHNLITNSDDAVDELNNIHSDENDDTEETDLSEDDFSENYTDGYYVNESVTVDA